MTDDEDLAAEFQALLLNSYSLINDKTIIKMLKEHNSKFSKAALREQAKNKIVELYKKGLTFKEILKEINYIYSYNSIKKILIEANIPLRGHGTYTRRERAKMALELREKGYQYKTIAHAIGYSNTSSVYNLLNKFGINNDEE